MREGIIFIISGPSGGGKTTLVKKVLESSENLMFSVSYTTRRPRDGEVDGKDYKFVSEEEFRKMIGEGRFVEYAEVHEHLYGTPVNLLEEAKSKGTDLILDIDVQGASQIRNKYDSGVYCFVLPSSFKILKERLSRRASEHASEVEKRLSEARQEMEDIDYYDYIIINDCLDEAVNCLSSVITAARCENEKVSVRIDKDYFS